MIHTKKADIDIISFCSEEFKIIRELDDITDDQISSALNEELNRNQVFKAGQGSGASGSFFFFSFCNRFLIKTLRRDEKEVMLKMMDDYVNHIKEVTDNGSFLARIYGCFTIKTPNLAPIDLIILQNTALMANSNRYMYEFDLKGSTYKRRSPFNFKS